MQALWQLLMPSFHSFLEDADEECYNYISRMAAYDDPPMIPALITSLDQEYLGGICPEQVR